MIYFELIISGFSLVSIMVLLFVKGKYTIVKGGIAELEIICIHHRFASDVHATKAKVFMPAPFF